ncbi:hypothetical protein DERP_014552 [Dermatophagoides pteronyssinus]|uniref:Uncharacterized protein n=1 Tax=Dermatophagoides pteronyssinus TaxID=6956 RepID=A0ABQ8J209_DERPT|nr:hypothetical protein DERP_014552 [Dermatophagoides pteronyssinus]
MAENKAQGFNFHVFFQCFAFSEQKSRDYCCITVQMIDLQIKINSLISENIFISPLFLFEKR